MVRDMDFVRTLLFAIEARPSHDPFGVQGESVFPEKSVHDVYQHLEQLEGAGFIRVSQRSALHDGTEMWYMVRLTWKGAEFLDDIRADTTWNKVKVEVGKKAGAASAAVLSELARHFARQYLGMP